MKFLLRKSTSFIVFVVIFAGIQNVAEARSGGRGGGGGRGSSRSGSQSGSRGQSSSSIRSAKTAAAVSGYRGPTYKSSYWKTSMAATTLWGLSSYKQRQMYRDHPDEEPTVCFNALKPKNGEFAYFICPQHGQSDSYVYCCGDDGNQKCCTFWDDGGRMAGVVIGTIIGVALLTVGIVVGIVFLVRYWSTHRGRRKNTANKEQEREQALDSAEPLTKVENEYSDYLGKDDQTTQPAHHPLRNHQTEPHSHHSEYHSHPSDHPHYENQPHDSHSYDPQNVETEPGYEPVQYGFKTEVQGGQSTSQAGYSPSSRRSRTPPPPYVDI